MGNMSTSDLSSSDEDDVEIIDTSDTNGDDDASVEEDEGILIVERSMAKLGLQERKIDLSSDEDVILQPDERRRAFQSLVCQKEKAYDKASALSGDSTASGANSAPAAHRGLEQHLPGLSVHYFDGGTDTTSFLPTDDEINEWKVTSKEPNFRYVEKVAREKDTKVFLGYSPAKEGNSELVSMLFLKHTLGRRSAVGMLHVSLMYTKASFRQRGFMTVMMAKALKHIKCHSETVVRSGDNPTKASVRLYRSLAFKNIGPAWTKSVFELTTELDRNTSRRGWTSSSFPGLENGVGTCISQLKRENNESDKIARRRR